MRHKGFRVDNSTPLHSGQVVPRSLCFRGYVEGVGVFENMRPTGLFTNACRRLGWRALEERHSKLAMVLREENWKVTR